MGLRVHPLPLARRLATDPQRPDIQERGRNYHTLDDSSMVLSHVLSFLTYVMQIPTSCP
jgi:hypothetical protein